MLLREHLVACHGGELAVGLFFASWFGWIAVGSALHRALARAEARRAADATGGGAPRRRRLLVLFALYPAAAVTQALALRGLRALAGVAAADVFPVDALLWSTALVNAPVGLLTGLAFPRICALLERPGEAPQTAATRGYVVEALGAFGGGLGATLAILVGASPLQVLAGAALTLTGIGAALAWERQQRGIGAALAAEAALALAVLVTPLGPALEHRAEVARFAHALPGVTHLRSLDTPHGHLALGRRGDQLVALGDGRLLAALPDADGDRLTAALLIAQQPDATAVLLVGQGADGLAGALLDHGVEHVALLQPDARAARAVADATPEPLRTTLASDRLTRIHGDPRALLRGAATRGAATRGAAGQEGYDLVVLAAGDPTTAGAARLATVEFFEACAAAMPRDGVLAAAITSATNYLGAENRSYGASAWSTIGAAFDEVVVLPGETTWLVAGPEGGPSADPDELWRRYRSRPGEPRLPGATFASLIDPRRVAEVTARYAATADAEGATLHNTDARPVAYLLQLRVLAHTTGSRLVEAIDAARAGGRWLLVIPLLVAAAVWLRGALLWPDPAAEHRRGGRWLLGIAGGAAIAMQVSVILSFQVRFGDLFLQIGWLNALFMAGLAGGGALAARAAAAASGVRATAAAGAAMGGLGVVVGLALPALQGAPAGIALPAYYALVGLGGAVFGAVFPVAGRLVALGEAEARGAAHVGAVLESADHWGAAAGAALVGLVAIPLLGPAATALWLAAATSATAAALVLPAWLRGSTGSGRAGASALPGDRWRARALERLAATGRRRPHEGRRAGGWLAGITIAAVAMAAAVRAGGDGPDLTLDEGQLAAAIRAPRIGILERPFLHYRGLDARDRATGDAACASRAVTDRIEGYGGPLNLLVATDADGTIREVRLLDSEETPAYLVGFDDWLAGLRGLPRDAPIAPAAGTPVEVLTGATVSSAAALATVDAVRAALATRALGLPPPPRHDAPSPWTRPPVIVLALLGLVAVPVLLGGRRWPRTALLLGSLALAGIWLNQQLSLEPIGGLARGTLPGAGNAEGRVLLAVAGGLALAFGAAYCGQLCPFGAAQELLSSRLALPRPSPRVDRAARGLKYGVLTAAVVGLLASGSHAWLAFDPLQTRLGTLGTGAARLLAVFALGGALIYPRFWCRYLCPTGALLALANRVALLRRRLPPRRHDRCDLGVASAADGDCIQCNRCRWRPAPPATEPSPTRRRWLDLGLAVLLGACLALAAVAISSARLPGTDGGAVTRPVDTEEIRRRIESRELSDHPADYWEPLD